MSNQAKWDDPKLTPKVAWAMGVEAAGKYADANGGRVDREPRGIDWQKRLSKRQERGIHVHWDNLATDCLPTKTLHHAFFNGWQAQRVGLLKEYIWDMLGKGLVYCCISDHDIERIFDEFHDRVKIDPWFAGAGE